MTKKTLKIILSALLLIVVAVVGYFAVTKKSVPIDQNQVVFTETSMGDTSDWKTYTYSPYGFEFKYPTNYHMSQVATTDDFPPKGVSYLLHLYDSETRASIQIFTRDSFDLKDIQDKYAPTGNPSLPEKKNFGQNTFYYYGMGGGGVAYPDQYFYNLNGETLIFIFNGPYENEKTPSLKAKQMEGKILSSFKFTDIIESQACGGNAAFDNSCPSGYRCEVPEIPGLYDVPGKCVKI